MHRLDFIHLRLQLQILRVRPELRLVISSATVEAEKLAAFFSTGATKHRRKAGAPSEPGAAILTVQGRTYPVQLHYLKVPYLKLVNTSSKLHYIGRLLSQTATIYLFVFKLFPSSKEYETL